MTTNQQLNDALASNYLLVSLGIRSWSGKRTDREATQEVIASKQAAQDSGAFVKKLLASADGELKDVHSAANAMRAYVYARTLPWTMNSEGAKKGERLVATSDSMQFLKEVSELKRQYDAAVMNLQSVWDARVLQATANLGKLANPLEYPSAAAIPGLFSVSVEVRPLPAIGDFARLNVPAALQEALAKRMAAQAETQMRNAMTDLRDRLLEELNRLAGQLGKVGAGEKTRLYDSMITSTENLVRLARNMNLTGSPKLEQLANDIEARLLAHPVEVYKHSQTVAAQAAEAARAMIKTVESDDEFFF